MTENQEHRGSFGKGLSDEFGLVWTCDDDCPHPEHDDDEGAAQ